MKPWQLFGLALGLSLLAASQAHAQDVPLPPSTQTAAESAPAAASQQALGPDSAGDALVIAASGSFNDLQRAINTVHAAGGGQVRVPEGRFVWGEDDDYLAIPGGVDMIGAGPGKTILQVITYTSAMFDVNHYGVYSEALRISGISFVGWITNAGFDNSMSAIALGSVRDFRIDHCQFEGFANAISIKAAAGYPNPVGVVDHCLLQKGDMPYGSARGITVQAYWEGDERLTNLGTGEAVFIEDNTFIDLPRPTASFGGGHYVARYNTFRAIDNEYAFPLSAHGPNLYTSERGTRCLEIYHNLIEDLFPRTKPNMCAIMPKAGGGVVFSNTIRNFEYAVLFALDTTTTTYPALDQVHDYYIWGNAVENVTTTVGVYGSTVQQLVQEGRDYFLRAPSPGLDGFSYTPYTYPHPLISTERIDKSLALVGAPADRAIRLNWHINTTLPATSTWQISCGSPAAPPYPLVTAIVSSTRAYTLAGLLNDAAYTVTLTAVGAIPPLSATVHVTPTESARFGPMIAALSCSDVDIQAAVDQVLAAGGGTVHIPAGECVIDDPIVFVLGEGETLIIRGAGVDKTILTNGTSGQFVQTCGSGELIRFTGITFRTAGDLMRSSSIRLTAPKNFRIDHCSFAGNWYGGISLFQAAKGLIDHNEFINPDPLVSSYGIVLNSYYQASGTSDAEFWGSNWDAARKQDLGTENALFVEDNTFSDLTSSVVASWASFAKATVRHNSFYANNSYTQLKFRSGAYFNEVYDNTFINTGQGKACEFHTGGVAFNNRFVRLAAFGDIAAYDTYAGYNYPADTIPNNLYLWNNTGEDGAYSSDTLGFDSGYAWSIRTTTGVAGETGGSTGHLPLNEGDEIFTRAPQAGDEIYPYIPYEYPHPLTREQAQDLLLYAAPADQAIDLTWDVNTTLPATSTWRISYYSQAVTSPTSITSIISPTRAYTLRGLSNHSWYTVTLGAMLGARPILSATERAMPTDIFAHVVAVQPENAAHTAAPNAHVSVLFRLPVSAASVSSRTFTVRGSQTGDYTGVYSVTGQSVTFDAARDFRPGEEVMVSLSGGMRATSGLTLTPHAWGFRISVGGGGDLFVSSGQNLGAWSSHSVALGDLDGDNDLDAFVGHGADGEGQPNKVWLNNGTASFTDSGQGLGSSDTRAVALGDVDGDGDLDAWVGNYGQPAQVWLNDGGAQGGTPGHFTSSGQALGSSYASQVALADLDNDGDLDAFVAHRDGAQIWLNDGGAQGGTSSHFTDSGQLMAGSNTTCTALGDLDGDGDLDAFVGRDGQPDRVWLNDGGVQGGTPGHFTDGGQGLGSSNTRAVALGDVDGDGDLDAWVGNYGQPGQVWLNDGGAQGGAPGHFTDSGQGLGSSNTRAVALGDVDGDGDLDAWVGNYGQPGQVWLNDGGAQGGAPGHFTCLGQALGQSSTESVAMGDLDGDGDLDVFAGNGGDQPDVIWLNVDSAPGVLNLAKTVSSPTARPGDTLTYQVVLNATAGTVTANLTDTLPAGLTHVPGSVRGGASYEKGQVRYTGPVTPGSAVLISYQATVDASVASGSFLYNTVVVTGGGKRLERSAVVAVPDTGFDQTLVLIAAGGDNDMSDSMLQLINTAEKSAGNSHAVVLVQLDGPGDGDSYVYRLQEDDGDESCPNYSNPTCDGRYVWGHTIWPWGEDNGSPYSLAEFLKGALQSWPNARQVVLSLVGHGDGWYPDALPGQPSQHDTQAGGLLWDKNPSNSLSTRELSQALYWSKQATGRGIDLLFLDACLMGASEVAYALRGEARYLLASESEKWAALPYDLHLNAIDAVKGAREIGQAWLQNELYALVEDGYPLTYALLDLGQMEAVQTAEEELAAALAATLPGERAAIEAAWMSSACFDSNQDGAIGPQDYACDVKLVAEQIELQFSGHVTVVNAAQAVQNAVAKAVVSEAHSGGVPWKYPAQSWEWGELGGLSQYLPLRLDNWKRGYYPAGARRALLDAYWNAAPPTCPPDCSPLPDPRLAAISAQARAGRGTIRVNWLLQAPIANMAGYELYRVLDGGNRSLITTTLSSQYNDGEAGLVPGTRYCYQVDAVDGGGGVTGQSNVTCARFGEVTLWIPEQAARPADRGVGVPVNLDNGDGLCPVAFGATIVYDPAVVTPTGQVLPTIYTPGYVFMANVEKPGWVKVVSIGQCQALSGPGSLFHVLFDVVGNEGGASPLNFVVGITNTYLYDRDDLLTPVTLNLQGGSLRVQSLYSPGNVNGDGVVNAVDAYVALEISAGRITAIPQQQVACDMNGDRECDSADVTLILNMAVCGRVNCGARPGSAAGRLVAPGASPLEPVSLSIGPLSGSRGQLVQVPVQIANGTEFAGGDFAFTFDAETLTAGEAKLAALGSGFILATALRPGMVRVALASTKPITDDGVLFTLQFLIENEPGAPVNFATARLHDAYGRDLEASALHRTIELHGSGMPSLVHRIYLPVVIKSGGQK